MLETRYNNATGTQEIVRLTPGAWSLAGLPGERLAGHAWAVEGCTPPEAALAALGLAQEDEILLYRIALERVVPAHLDLQWDPASDRAYRLFQEAFAGRWQREGIDESEFRALWTDPRVERAVSGVCMAEGMACGLILAERTVEPGELFYRTFGVSPDHQGQGHGLELYQTSLSRAYAGGYTTAYWCCFEGNTAIRRLMERLGAHVVGAATYWEGPLERGRSGEL
jgi:RimJ/RimL family protein N-acetyltransferase